MNEDE